MREPIYSFSLPFLPPSVNRLYKPGSGPKRITKSAEGYIFEANAASLMPKWHRDPFTEPVFVNVVFHFKRITVGDGDNRLKALFDLLQQFEILKNDALIYECHYKKVPSAEDRTVVQMFRLQE